jgi:hypothetical protein
VTHPYFITAPIPSVAVTVYLVALTVLTVSRIRYERAVERDRAWRVRTARIDNAAPPQPQDGDTGTAP